MKTPEDKPNTNKASEAELAAIDAAKAALAPFVRISPDGEQKATNRPESLGPDDPAPLVFTGLYRINRCGETVTLTGDQIRQAVDVAGRKDATLADLRKAIRPFAKLPPDFRVEDATVPIYTFRGVDGQPVAVTNAMIRAARAVAATE